MLVWVSLTQPHCQHMFVAALAVNCLQVGKNDKKINKKHENLEEKLNKQKPLPGVIHNGSHKPQGGLTGKLKVCRGFKRFLNKHFPQSQSCVAQKTKQTRVSGWQSKRIEVLHGSGTDSDRRWESPVSHSPPSQSGDSDWLGGKMAQPASTPQSGVSLPTCAQVIWICSYSWGRISTKKEKIQIISNTWTATHSAPMLGGRNVSPVLVHQDCRWFESLAERCDKPCWSPQWDPRTHCCERRKGGNWQIFVAAPAWTRRLST